MIWGFNYNGKHSSTLDVYFKSIDRPVLPEARRNTYVIPGRHGDVVFGEKEHENRPITLRLIVLYKTLPELRAKVRQLADWLNKDGQLIFDDEPDKSYSARVDNIVSLEQTNASGEFDLTFICKPFATSINYFQNIYTGVSSGKEMQVVSKGSQPTPCIIIIKNTGTININNITITRKAVNR